MATDNASREMNIDREPILPGLWALTWRAVLFAPLMLVTFMLQLALGFAFLGLPLLAAFWFSSGMHVHSTMALAGWSGLLWAWRRFRWRRLYE